jgi:hypothetical protein
MWFYYLLPFALRCLSIAVYNDIIESLSYHFIQWHYLISFTLGLLLFTILCILINLFFSTSANVGIKMKIIVPWFCDLNDYKQSTQINK